VILTCSMGEERERGGGGGRERERESEWMKPVYGEF
jgi:hypothetical protein